MVKFIFVDFLDKIKNNNYIIIFSKMIKSGMKKIATVWLISSTITLSEYDAIVNATQLRNLNA